MGFYVHISVVFACDRNDGVAALAAKHLPALLDRQDDGQREARWFLEDLAKRSGANNGPKGGLSLWGMIGNCTRADVFVETLTPFFADLLASDVDGGPGDFEHILIFYEPEQTEHAAAYEVFLAEGEMPPRLVVKHHEHLPFAWMQF